MSLDALPGPVGAVVEAARGDSRAAKVGRAVVGAIVFYIGVQLVFSPPQALFLFGIASGSLYGILAVGLILIYRTNRIINFAAAAIGAIPAIFAVLTAQLWGWPYPVTFLIALVGGPLLGGLVDILVIRRFATAPRLILTVATIGIAQVLAFVAIWIPIWMGAEKGIQSFIKTPWQDFRINTKQNTLLLNGDYIVAVVAAVVMAAGLAAFFRFTRMGIALRASAENADRAALLGIPVRRVGTVSWMIAGLFGSMTIFLRSPLIGVPSNGTLGYTVLLFTLAAAVVARMESIPLAVMAGIAAAVIEQSSVVSTGSSDLSNAIMLAFILGALLFQRGTLSRAYDSGVSTWQALKEYRPIPTELRNLPEVRGAKAALAGIVLAIVLIAPFLVSEGEVAKLAALPIFAVVAVSLVILTGWAGQISLGQFAIVGAGAVTAGKLAADFNQDFWVTFVAGALAGAVVAVVVGIPAVRIQGLFLAVTTLALAAATQFYFLKRTYSFGNLVLPSVDNSRIERPVLWERLDLGPDRTYYWFCCVILLLVLLAATSFRRHRSGRVLIAARDNVRAAPSYSINLVRTRLAAFAVAGAIAGIAGVLQVYQSKAVDASTYGILPSVSVFLSTVIGGLTSLPGAVTGAVVIGAVNRFGDPRIDGISLLVSGPGLLLILMFLPGGFAQAGYGARDAFLRWTANRRGILVPSLVADRRVEDARAEDDVVSQAEHRVETVDGFDVLAERRIACPVCGEILAVEAAADHDHLQPAGSPA